MKNFSKILLCFFILGLIVYPVSAKTIDVKNIYQDSNGNWLKEDAINLSLFPLYTVTQDTTTYTLTRFGETVTLPKRTWISYNFYPDRIVPVITINSFAHIDSLVTKVNSTAWYITVPFSASNVMSVTDDLIGMGVFKRTTSISIKDSNTTCSETNPCKQLAILPKVIDGDIRLYFNPQTYSNVVYPLILTENTITVTNASTSGFTTANISLNGSRWTDSGQLAINLNASYLNGLVAYYSFDENTGTTIHNVNTDSGLINTTNQGTWNGNTTLNYTNGMIGNAGLFDGVNDYVDAGNGASLNISSAITVSAWIKTSSSLNQGIIAKQDTYYPRWSIILGSGVLRTFIRNSSGSGNNVAGTKNIADNLWHYVVVSRIDGGNVTAYIDGQQEFTYVSPTGDINPSAKNVVIGLYNYDINYNYFNGSIDETRIYNRSLSPLEISEEYNRSMRVQAMPTILNQSASVGNVINRTRIIYSGQDSINNISIYARQNGTTSWDLIQENATSNTWYSITNQYQVMDFGLMMSGNGSNTVFFESLEWDETTAPSTPTTLLRSYQWNISGIGSVTQAINNIINNYYNITNGTTQADLNLKANKSGDNMTGDLFTTANITIGNLTLLPSTNNSLYYKVDGVYVGWITKTIAYGLYDNKPIRLGHIGGNYGELYRNSSDNSITLQGYGLTKTTKLVDLDLDMGGKNITNCANCANTTQLNDKVNKSGDTMTGTLNTKEIDVKTGSQFRLYSGLDLTNKYFRQNAQDIGSGTSGDMRYNFDAITNTSNGALELVYFRNTNTTGSVKYVIQVGNGTGAVNTQLGANQNSYFNALLGGVSIGKSTITSGYKLDVADSARFEGNVTVVGQSGTGTRAACFDSTGHLIASTNATSNYLTC